MKRNRNIITPILILAALAFAGSVQAQETEVAFHWAPSPVESPDGDALSPAVAYQVWLTVEDEVPELVATVHDTIFSLDVEHGLIHRLSVRGVDVAGRWSEMSELSSPVYFELEEERGEQAPMAGSIRSIYPNPFNPETRIAYDVPADLPAGSRVRLEIFNLAGQRVRLLETENTPGQHEVTWNGTDDAGQPASSGMYVTRYVCGTLVESKKMTMLK